MMRRVAGLAVAVVLLGAQGAAPPSGPAPGAATGGANTGTGVPQVSPPDSWVPRGTAELIMLDKLRAQPSPLSIKTGQSGSFGTLTVAVKSCVSRPADLPQNSGAFLEITDSRQSAPVFRGWVLANTPSVSQYEHPVYDLRLVACR